MSGVAVVAIVLAAPAAAFTLWPLLRARRTTALLLPPDEREQIPRGQGLVFEQNRGLLAFGLIVASSANALFFVGRTWHRTVRRRHTVVGVVVADLRAQRQHIAQLTRPMAPCMTP